MAQASLYIAVSGRTPDDVKYEMCGYFPKIQPVSSLILGNKGMLQNNLVYLSFTYCCTPSYHYRKYWTSLLSLHQILYFIYKHSIMH